jgi:hypothetical protein
MMTNIHYDGQCFWLQNRPEVKLFLDMQIGRFDLVQTADLLLRQYPTIGYDLMPSTIVGDESKIEFPPQSILLYSHLSNRPNDKTRYCSASFEWQTLTITNQMLSSVKVEHWGETYEVDYTYSILSQIPMIVLVGNSETGEINQDDSITCSSITLSYKSQPNRHELDLFSSTLNLEEMIGPGLVITGKLLDTSK